MLTILYIEPFFNEPNCEYDLKDVAFGGANAAILISLGNSYPAIFKCEFGFFLNNINMYIQIVNIISF